MTAGAGVPVSVFVSPERPDAVPQGHRGFHVRFADPAPGTADPAIVEVHALFPGQPPGHGGGADAAVVQGGGLSGNGPGSRDGQFAARGGDRLFQVRLGHPLVAAGGANVVEVDAQLLRQATRYGRGGNFAVVGAAGQTAEIAATRFLRGVGGCCLGRGGGGRCRSGARRLPARCGGCRFRLGRCVGRFARPATMVADEVVDVGIRCVGVRQHTQQTAYREGFTGTGDDPAQHPVGGCIERIDDLGGFDVHQLGTGGHLIALREVPFADHTFGHLHAPFGHGNRFYTGHDQPPKVSRTACSMRSSPGM